MFPALRKLRQDGFEFTVRLCVEKPSQQNQYCIPFSWAVFFSIFLSENYGCGNENLGGVTELSAKVKFLDEVVPSLSDGPNSSSFIGEVLDTLMRTEKKEGKYLPLLSPGPAKERHFLG